MKNWYSKWLSPFSTLEARDINNALKVVSSENKETDALASDITLKGAMNIHSAKDDLLMCDKRFSSRTIIGFTKTEHYEGRHTSEKPVDTSRFDDFFRISVLNDGNKAKWSRKFLL